MNFIQTSDKETRDILKRHGFKEISNSFGIYVFINDKSKMNFDKTNLKFTYTNKICI